MNINSHHEGRKVIALGARTRRLAADFPGWGDPSYADHLLPIPAGLTGVVTRVESHGSDPYTRYAVKFDDDSTASGLALGVDVNWA